jgi:hypothetical protein
MCTTLSDLLVSLDDTSWEFSVSEPSLWPLRSTGVASISVALPGALGLLVSMLLQDSDPLLRPDERPVRTGMVVTLVMSLGFVLLDVRMGGDGLVFMDDDPEGAVRPSFCRVAVPFACSNTSLVT